MANKSKPKFDLKQRVKAPSGGISGVVIQRLESVHAEPAYLVLFEPSYAGPPQPTWYGEMELLAANTSIAATPDGLVEVKGPLNLQAFAQLRARRKASRKSKR